MPDELAEVFEGVIASLLFAIEEMDPEATKEKREQLEGSSKAERMTPAEVERLAGDIATEIAFDAADHFMDIAKTMEAESIKAVVKTLEDADPEDMVPVLRALFLASGKVEAAKEMDLLDICDSYEPFSYDIFQDTFLDTDAIDWICIENWLAEKNEEYNNKLN